MKNQVVDVVGMSAAERAAKLLVIAGLSADQIDGWEAVAKERGYFEGELAALMARYRVVRQCAVNADAVRRMVTK